MSGERHITKSRFTPEEFQQMSLEEKILKIAEGMEIPQGKPEEQVLNSLLDRIEKKEPTKVVPLIKYIQNIAAILLLALGIYTVIRQFTDEKVVTQYAQHIQVILPDGTEVALNSGSKLSYSRRNFIDKRVLRLKGEAFFNVKKGNRFLIQTSTGEVEVFGTQLNVFCRDKEFWVSCLSGKVGVTANKNMVVILPGEVAELTTGGLIKSEKNNIENTSSWKDGWSYFENRPLVSIFDEIERQFNVSIENNGLEGRYFTGNFPNKNLTEALDIVCSTMDLKYEIQKNRKVVITLAPK
jgi:transmembrane sensor